MKIDDIQVDSLSFIELIIAFEEEAEVRLEEESLMISSYVTVGDVVVELQRACRPDS